ncbi:non-hydrolyzing UDP-N-acetylglucosamine 2-epimerase [Thalassospira mesophila]|uniref:UDP-N-acetylglucosamine 2-epimerase (non-hydrolyzing) n=1 Tax=Thalassospira mesophila TaxID=1293891 RepID=A0A1Y2L4T3_9PROT|nr:UDP-N-acetylglucosamine 2-epimerase (non-hydrolyzing) [Thalassospira mesophila]OSQ40493.1 hypothetical protein TMES_01535 [Thalassospira mesophila]
MKVLTIIGTRPEAIKLAPVILELNKNPNIENITCLTGQHTDLASNILKNFNISNYLNIEARASSFRISQLLSNIIMGLEPILNEQRPDIVLVHGDTTSSLAGCLAGFYNKIDVAHVEAGLRTGNISSPWPEEGNRKLISSVSKYHFAPTEKSRLNLINENVSDESILVTGNTVIDALFLATKITDDESVFSYSGPKIRKNKKNILVTSHRRENFGDGIKNICLALNEITEMKKDVDIFYALHSNPLAADLAKEILNKNNQIKILSPQDYFDFIYLMKNVDIILTDSGGIQEEAPSLNKPVLVMRQFTERPEAVDAGCIEIVGTNKQRIVEKTTELLENSASYQKMTYGSNPYGDGHAAKRIVSFLMSRK